MKATELKMVKQLEQLENPDVIILMESITSNYLLGEYAYSSQGIATSDDMALKVNYWEFPVIMNHWKLFNDTPEGKSLFDGRTSLLRFDQLLKTKGANFSGKESWGKKGCLIGRVSHLPRGIYSGEYFKHTGIALTSKKDEYLNAICAFALSDEFNFNVRKMNQSLAIDNGLLARIPFDLEHWQQVTAEKYPNGLPKPYSDDPTQWLFHGHPIKTENPLQVAIARVLGYRWPAEEVNNTSAKVEAASSGFQKETDSGDIKNNAAGSSIYDTLDEEAKVLIDAVKAFDHLSDEDGIFCIPSVNAEQAGAERLRDFLQQVFAGEWNNQTIIQLLRKVEAASSSLDDYLRNEFFAQHCKLFQNRPFIWHIWDGRKDGFSALVNYHKLDKDNLSKLIYTYLNDWIRVCVAKKNAGESGAEGLLSAAQKLKENLEAILHGEAPYDIFVRWKPLDQQPIGWEPDLNDGVRLNIRPFVEAGVLRNKFNVKWGVDRGKNPPGSFWGEVRDNDKHLSLAEKREARE